MGDMVKLAAHHNIEDRILEAFGLDSKAVVPTSNVLRFQLQEQQHNLSAKSTPSNNNDTGNTSRRKTEWDPTDFKTTATQTSIAPPPSSVSNYEDPDDTIKPDNPSSTESSVVLAIQVETIESPLEWSARMKRYQQEEIQYLGLNLIKAHHTTPLTTPLPKIPLLTQQSSPPVIQNTTLAANIKPKITAPLVKSSGEIPYKDTALSRRRFEEWLDTLHVKASPAIPASQPSTSYAASEKGLEVAGEEDRKDACVQDLNVFDGCIARKGIWNGYSEMKFRDWGVQTDVSGCLISI